MQDSDRTGFGSVGRDRADDAFALAPRPADPRDPRARQQALVALARCALSPPNRSVLLHDAAAMLAEMLGAELCGAAEIAEDGQSLLVNLFEGSRGQAGSAVRTLRLGASGGESLPAYVLQVAHSVVVRDLARDKRFRDRVLRSRGIGSAVAVPLKLHDRPYGCLMACSAEPAHFGDDDALFTETAAHLVTMSLARLGAEQALADERRLAAGVLETVEAMVVMLDGDWRIVRMNRAARRITGFSPAEAGKRPIWSLFAVAEEVEAFRAATRRLQKGGAAIEFESRLLTRDGQRRHVRWSLGAALQSGESPAAMIATGIDITAQRAAEAAAQQAERIAEDARKVAADSRAGRTLIPADGLDELPAEGQAQRAAAFKPRPRAISAERRGRPRRSFPYTQKVAFVREGRMPDRGEFTEVQCHDIAAGGFSFLSPGPPAADSLVAALGTPPRITYLVAQIAHVTRVERDGKTAYLVGCSYTGRANYDPLR